MLSKNPRESGFFDNMFKCFCVYAIFYGNNAKNLARLTAWAICRWCLAQEPVFFLGRIFPVPEVNLCKVSVSLKLTCLTFF